MKWVKRIGLGLLAAIGLAAALGAIYEQVIRRLVARGYPAPGRLVDIGGRRLHLDCRGTGHPIVVLEAGLDMNGSLAWAPVHDSIAATTRACAYSRAGLMWSDDKAGPHTAATIAADLRAALDAAAERGPYVMVGHSLGGPYIMAFTKRFGPDVAGLVFVDASHPDQVERLKEATGKALEPPFGPLKAFAALVWTGLPRLLIPADTSSSLTGPVRSAMAAYAATSLGPMLAEADGMTETMTEAGTFRTLGDRPLIVLTAMAPIDAASLAALKLTTEQGATFQQVWRALHEEEASWSSRSEHVIVPDATHYIQRDRPDIVIAAVRKVVHQVSAAPDR